MGGRMEKIMMDTISTIFIEIRKKFSICFESTQTMARATRNFHVFMGKWFSRVIWLIVDEDERRGRNGEIMMESRMWNGRMSSINAKNINKLKLLKCLDALFHPLGHSLLFVFISLAYNFILRKGSQISHISHWDEKSSTTMDGHESQERYEMAQSDDGISKLFTWPSWNETRRTWKIVFRSRHHRVTEKFHFSQFSTSILPRTLISRNFSCVWFTL